MDRPVVTDPGVPDGGVSDDGQGVAARQTALTALVQVHDQSAWASPVVDRTLSASGLDARDRAFVANLVFSTLRWEGTLDWILGHLITRDLADVETTLLDVLRLGTYELRLGAAPDHAGVHSWVEVARQVVGERATGFVNGVLRGVVRKTDELPWPDPLSDRGMALAHGYPAWMVGSARARFGDQRLAAVLDAGNRPAPLTLRAVVPREELIAELAAAGIAASPGSLSDLAVVLKDRVVPGDLPAITDGRAIVQDQSSQVVGALAAAGLPAGSVAIDLCAAPGGKATHLAQMGLDVTAVDRHAGRLRRTAQMAERLGLSMVTRVADGADSGLPAAAADVVLVDAPCSGLGVVRRRPELRWRKTPGDVSSLTIVQERLLRAALQLVRPDGKVVYSVCTWTQAETDVVVAKVVDAGLATTVSAPMIGTTTSCGLQLSPDEQDGDGMYMAVLQRKG